MQGTRICGVWSVIAFLLASAIAVSAAEVTFYCPYDGAADAARASGRGFAVHAGCAFADGRVGGALDVGASSRAVFYAGRGNLDKARGSIGLWVRPNWDGRDAQWRALVWEEGPTKAGGGSLWLWKYGNSIRFDMRDPGDHYLTASVARWQRGEWHHVVAVWDAKQGTRLYLDGKLAVSKDFTWTPRSYSRFSVGNTAKGDRPANARIDELRMYSNPLSAEEAAAAYGGALDLTFRSPRPRPKVRVREREPKLIFHLPFDTDTSATFAKGNPAPRESKGVTLVPGLKGKAATFGRGARLRFAEAGNLVKDRGTISMWFRSDWSGDQTATANQSEIWRCLFREGPLKGKRHGTNLLWLWFWGSRLRFDVSDHRDRYVTRSLGEWPRGQWHHVVVTWDARRERRLYLDGEPVRGGRDSRKAFLPMKWQAQPFDEFFVGSDGASAVAEGGIDDLKIFDGPLSDEAVRAELATVFPVSVRMPRRYFVAGRTSRLRWSLQSLSRTPVAGSLTWRLVSPSGAPVLGEADVRLSMAPNGAKRFDTAFTPVASGQYQFVSRWQSAGGGVECERRISCWCIEPEAPRRAGGELALKPVETIDCASDLGPEKFVAQGPTRVVRSSLGAYREADIKRNSRFALRVRMPNVGRPYVIDWEYPDDKPRTMEMIAQTVQSPSRQYELQTGAFCGGEYPLSKRMMTQRSIFWPRGEDVALIFMTAEKGRPAAAARVSVYEVQGRLPKLPVRPAKPVNGWSRMVGLYYEDPAFCYDFGGYTAMPGFKLTIDRLTDYMDYFGQNLFMYPAVWYHGPFYPSESQGVAMSRSHPTNFIEYMLLRFGQRGIHFIPTLNVHYLPSLAEEKWDDAMLDTGEAASGPIMMLWDGAPNLTGWHGTPPNYNPLHPQVQRAVLVLVDEMLDLYADYPAFKGICFHLTKHCMLSFGSIDAGYNDYCVEAFERATGIRVPVGAESPGRVNQRYRWLMANARDQWIARDRWIEWRCRALHAFYERIAEKLRRRRPDLKLILTLYRPNKRDIVGDARFNNVRDYVAQINRESGVDAALYKDSPNIVVQRTIYPADYRWYRAHRRYAKDPIEIRQLHVDSRHFSVLGQAREGWINMHDRYWEDAVGRGKKWKTFWGNETGWRVSTLNANQNHCLESYAIPLARADALSFTKGGFLVGTIGIERQVGRFTQAFRALPAAKFRDIPGLDGPVVGRFLPRAEGMYLYLVNPTPRAADASVRFDRRPESLRDLATGKAAAVSGRVQRLRLSPYGLVAYFVKGAGVARAN